MRVLVCNADEQGCGFYRMMEPARVLKDQGHDIVLDPYASTIRCKTDLAGQVLWAQADADVVVFQRPMSRDGESLVRALQANGTRVVVELDDDLWNLERTHVMYAQNRPSSDKLHHVGYLSDCLRAADLVTVSTPALARLIPNPRVVVLANMIPQWYLDCAPDYGEGWSATDGRQTVVWAGLPGLHAGDLRVVKDGVRRAVRGSGTVFVGLGDPDIGPQLGFADGEALWSPFVPLEVYPKALKCHDFGIVPLKDNLFNRSKSYLKGLEYAALGIPFVASPLPEYQRLAGHGVGLLAKDHEWGRVLAKLIRDPEDQREAGLAFARQNTYERNAWRWLEAWTSN